MKSILCRKILYALSGGREEIINREMKLKTGGKLWESGKGCSEN